MRFLLKRFFLLKIILVRWLTICCGSTHGALGTASPVPLQCCSWGFCRGAFAWAAPRCLPWTWEMKREKLSSSEQNKKNFHLRNKRRKTCNFETKKQKRSASKQKKKNVHLRNKKVLLRNKKNKNVHLRNKTKKTFTFETKQKNVHLRNKNVHLRNKSKKHSPSKQIKKTFCFERKKENVHCTSVNLRNTKRKTLLATKKKTDKTFTTFLSMEKSKNVRRKKY